MAIERRVYETCATDAISDHSALGLTRFDAEVGGPT
jgi:hypothetical protein